MKNVSLKFSLQGVAATAIGALLTFGLNSCGGASKTTTPPPTSATSATAVLLNIGDSPSDQVMAMSVTISAMNFTNPSGSSVAAISSPATVEMMHLMATMQPIAMPKLPQGTYSQLSMTISSAIVTYVDPSTHSLVQKTLATPMSFNIALSPAFVVGSSSMVMNLDMDVAHSVSIDASGNVTMTPTFRAFSNTAMANATDPEHGMMEHMIGSVSGVSGSSFTMTTLQGMQMNFGTGTGTQFQNMGGMGSMGSGNILMMDGIMQSDGTMNANYVQQMMTSGGAMAMGTIGSVTGSPATQLSLVPMDGIGSGMTTSALASGMTVTVGSTTAYSIDTTDADMHSLPFTPVFDSTHIFAGQMVSTVSSSGMMSGGGMMGGGMGGVTNSATQTATAVELEPQGFNGVVANYSASSGTATFTLTLPSNSAFASLAGATSITVHLQAGTQLRDLTGVSNGMNIHVRGLLFNDAGVYKLVATRMSSTQ